MALMGTGVTIEVVGHGDTPTERRERDAVVHRAFDWFHHVEATCSRFDEESELRQLCLHVGVAVPVSPSLFHALTFALAVAEDSNGTFDPTIGQRMESLGFNRHYVTGDEVQSPSADPHANWRDVMLDRDANTVTLRRACTLDLGAVAKGMAVDLAAQELRPFEHFAIDAGGDQYFGGHNASGEPWRVGIRHPRDREQQITTLSISNAAVCTSGDYERTYEATTRGMRAHHLIDARGGDPVQTLASVTTVAPTAIVADAMSTAAFALGPEHGAMFLQRHDLNAMLFTSMGETIIIGELTCV